MSCAFCENPDVQARVVFKSDLVQVFPTNIPIVPGHLIIAPLRCVPAVDDVTSEEWQAIKSTIIEAKQVLRELYGAEGFNVAWNEGVLAGQSVPHLHIHLLPRKKGDTGVTEYEPRAFLYRPGSREATPENELARVAEEIRSQFSKSLKN